MQSLPFKHEDLLQDSVNWTHVIQALHIHKNHSSQQSSIKCSPTSIETNACSVVFDLILTIQAKEKFLFFTFPSWWFANTRGLSPFLFLLAVLEHEKILHRQHLYSRTRHHSGYEFFLARWGLSCNFQTRFWVNTLTARSQFFLRTASAFV